MAKLNVALVTPERQVARPIKVLDARLVRVVLGMPEIVHEPHPAHQKGTRQRGQHRVQSLDKARTQKTV